jgi:hypothetical protein
MNLMALAFASLPDTAGEVSLPIPGAPAESEAQLEPGVEPGAKPQPASSGALFLQVLEEQDWGQAADPERAPAPGDAAGDAAGEGWPLSAPPGEFSRPADEIPLPPTRLAIGLPVLAAAPALPLAPRGSTAAVSQRTTGEITGREVPAGGALPSLDLSHMEAPAEIDPGRLPAAMVPEPQPAEQEAFAAVIWRAERREPEPAASRTPASSAGRAGVEAPRVPVEVALAPVEVPRVPEEAARTKTAAESAPATEAPVESAPKSEVPATADGRGVAAHRPVAPPARPESVAPIVRAAPIEPPSAETFAMRPVVREMSVRVETSPLESASLRFVERNGQVEVVVRASSPGLAASLQAEVPDLLRNLAQHDLQARVSAVGEPVAAIERVPAADAIDEIRRLAESRGETRGDRERAGDGERSGSERFEDSARRRHPRRRWEEEE